MRLNRLFRSVALVGALSVIGVTLSVGDTGGAVALSRHVPTAAGAASVFYRPTASFLVLKARHAGGYDWSDDGCSVPTVLRLSVSTLEYFARTFVAECEQHDFAYRNFGGRLRLDPSRTRRRSVDRFFLARLRERCRRADITAAGRRTSCLAYARVFYDAVRAFGRL
jgi:hypothetical protein